MNSAVIKQMREMSVGNLTFIAEEVKLLNEFMET